MNLGDDQIELLLCALYASVVVTTEAPEHREL